MTRKELLKAIVTFRQSIAPEVEPGGLARYQPLRNQVDLDSMDRLNFMVGLLDYRFAKNARLLIVIFY